jgi:hypothetical protein
MLQRARHDRAPTVACVDEGYTRVNVALRQAKEHARTQADAWQNDQLEQARAELRQILVFSNNARDAARAVYSCTAPR